MLVVSFACVASPSPHASAALVTAGSFGAVQTGSQDEQHESPRLDAEQRTSPRASLRGRLARSTRSGARRAVRTLQHHVGRWRQLPAAWRGPPVLLI